ncbi:MAG: hypothetical protein U0U46_07865 [Saprospiraceae bacterium]
MRYYLPCSLFLILAACTGGRRDIRAYYYPAENLAGGKVYEYASLESDSIPPDYWYFRSVRADSGLFLVGTYYDASFQVGQMVREKIDRSGSQVRDYFLYFPDSSGQRNLRVAARLESPDVFPFSVKDSSGVFLFSLQIGQPGDAGLIYLIRNRRYLGDAPDFEFKGKKYPCIRFGLREAIGKSAEGDAETESRGEEWYAEGLGLVYYRKEAGNKGLIRQEYRLRDIITMDELEQRARQQ